MTNEQLKRKTFLETTIKVCEDNIKKANEELKLNKRVLKKVRKELAVLLGKING